MNVNRVYLQDRHYILCHGHIFSFFGFHWQAFLCKECRGVCREKHDPLDPLDPLEPLGLKHEEKWARLSREMLAALAALAVLTTPNSSDQLAHHPCVFHAR